MNLETKNHHTYLFVFFLLHNIYYHNLKQWGENIGNFLAKTKWKLKIHTKFNFADSFLQVLNNCSHPCFVVLLGQHDWDRDIFSFTYVSSQNAIKAKINLKELRTVGTLYK